MKTKQFYQLTLEKAIAHYSQGDITAKGLVHLYFLIKCKSGWKIKLEPKKICEELGIRKSAFYNAISRLKAEGSIDWETPQSLLVSIKGSVHECGNQSANAESQSTNAESQSTNAESQSTNVESQSTNVESQSANVESQSTNAESQSTNAEKKSSKTAPRKRYKDSPDSYQIFIKSLSNIAREKFFDFVREKTAKFSPPLIDIEGWLASQNDAGQPRFLAYYQAFQKVVGEGLAPSQDWKHHPRWREAVKAMRKGVTRFIGTGYPGFEEMEIETRQAMVKYAEAREVIWGKGNNARKAFEEIAKGCFRCPEDEEEEAA